jgi:hypothetical protein
MAHINQHDIGDLIRMDAEFRNNQDVLTDPTTVTFKLKLPDGELIIYVYGTDEEVERLDEGIFRVEHLAEISGSHPYLWRGTGTVAQVEESSFYIKRSNF